MRGKIKKEIKRDKKERKEREVITIKCQPTKTSKEEKVRESKKGERKI